MGFLNANENDKYPLLNKIKGLVTKQLLVLNVRQKPYFFFLNIFKTIYLILTKIN